VYSSSGGAQTRQFFIGTSNFSRRKQKWKQGDNGCWAAPRMTMLQVRWRFLGGLGASSFTSRFSTTKACGVCCIEEEDHDPKY
jgi:hypothetical protein